MLAREGGADTGLVDRIEVAPGFEAALGAALGDDLDYGEAPAGAESSGWATLEGYENPAPLPPGARPIGELARGPEVLARRLGQTGIVSHDDGDRLQPLLAPGQRLVSVEGDLWRWDGLHLRAGDAQSAAALRLAQKNRLASLRESLTAAEERHERAEAQYQGTKQALTEASARDRKSVV